MTWMVVVSTSPPFAVEVVAAVLFAPQPSGRSQHLPCFYLRERRSGPPASVSIQAPLSGSSGPLAPPHAQHSPFSVSAYSVICKSVAVREKCRKAICSKHEILRKFCRG